MCVYVYIKENVNLYNDSNNEGDAELGEKDVYIYTYQNLGSE